MGRFKVYFKVYFKVCFYNDIQYIVIAIATKLPLKKEVRSLRLNISNRKFKADTVEKMLIREGETIDKSNVRGWSDKRIVRRTEKRAKERQKETEREREEKRARD